MAIAPAAASSAEPAEPPSEEIICVGDSCQSLPPEPEDPTPGTLVPNPGNPPRHYAEPKKHGKTKHGKEHHKRHHRKHHPGGAQRAERSQR
jgi:hypothetical protein